MRFIASIIQHQNRAIGLKCALRPFETQGLDFDPWGFAPYPGCDIRRGYFAPQPMTGNDPKRTFTLGRVKTGFRIAKWTFGLTPQNVTF